MADKPYYQNDKKWQNNKIGFSSSLTIGQVGCMLTCFAMTVNHFGGNETPLSLNNKMVNAKGFNDAWIKGAQVPGLFPNLGFQRQKSVECKNKPAPMSAIDAALAAGSLVMVQVDREADATFEDEDGHWVLLQEKQGDDYTMIDPWYSERDSKKTLVGAMALGANNQKILFNMPFGMAKVSSQHLLPRRPNQQARRQPPNHLNLQNRVKR